MTITDTILRMLVLATVWGFTAIVGMEGSPSAYGCGIVGGAILGGLVVDLFWAWRWARYVASIEE